MAESNCPICYSELISKEVSPCMECGGDGFELDHYLQHQYHEYEVYFGQRLILCDFCDVDFSSYDPTHFGFEKRTRIGFEDFNFVKEITDKRMRMDKYCPECNHRLPFLKFIHICRMENEKAHRLRSTSTKIQSEYTIDGTKFLSKNGFYNHVEQLFTHSMNWKIGRNLNAFNDILYGGFGRHDYNEQIIVQWKNLKKSRERLDARFLNRALEILENHESVSFQII